MEEIAGEQYKCKPLKDTRDQILKEKPKIKEKPTLCGQQPFLVSRDYAHDAFMDINVLSG